LTLSKQGINVGMRNMAAFNFGVFYRKAFPKKWKEKLREANKSFFETPLDDREIETIIRSLDVRKYEYTCSSEPIKSVCNYFACVKNPHGINVGRNQKDENGVTYQEVEFNDLRKYDCDPPRYVLKVNKLDIVLSSEEFQSFSKLRRRLFELLDLMVRPRTQTRWDKEVLTLIKTMKKIETPPEVSISGEVIELLHET
ncbi:hypothetical protein LCGC14_2666880, partial [marine sediment metagenome]